MMLQVKQAESQKYGQEQSENGGMKGEDTLKCGCSIISGTQMLIQEVLK